MTTQRFPAVQVLFLLAFLIVATGCMGETKAPVAKGPIDTSVASQLQAKRRSSNGNKYSVTHEYKSQEFNANWPEAKYLQSGPST